MPRWETEEGYEGTGGREVPSVFREIFTLQKKVNSDPREASWKLVHFTTLSRYRAKGPRERVVEVNEISRSYQTADFPSINSSKESADVKNISDSKSLNSPRLKTCCNKITTSTGLSKCNCVSRAGKEWRSLRTEVGNDKERVSVLKGLAGRTV